ncbi:hypothetical protein [Intestinibacter sp.]|uniref:hypothetical protein n=1 Tax=Intestinibacter sp. TaxID=1965304 RepID=UPI003F158BF3
MTMDNILKVLASIAIIGIIIYYALESKNQREQKSKNKAKKILSENVKFMIFGNEGSPNIALGKDNCIYLLDSNNVTLHKFTLDEVDDINIHYHIRADKNSGVISPSLTLNNQTFIDKIDLNLRANGSDYAISYVPYMKHAESNEVRSKIIQMKRFILMIEREKEGNNVVNN